MDSAQEGKSETVEQLEERVKQLERRMDELLSGKVALEIQELSVAPKSRLRVACE